MRKFPERKMLPHAPFSQGTTMFDGADPLMPTTEAKVSPERALGILLLAMLAITVLLMVRTH